MFHPVSSTIASPIDNAALNRNSLSGPSQNGAAGGTAPVNAAGQQMVQVNAGGGSGCLMCLGLQSGMIPMDKLEQLKATNLSKIMAHEQAHASAAGAFGGAIHIDYDSNGIAVGGHVPIMVPGLDRMNPEESLKAFNQILAAALAPSDPSGQDMSVAAQAQSLLGRAQVMMDAKQQRESLMATAMNGQPQGALPAAGQMGGGQMGGSGQGNAPPPGRFIPFIAQA